MIQMNILNLISHRMYKVNKAPIRALKMKKKMILKKIFLKILYVCNESDKGKDSSDELKRKFIKEQKKVINHIHFHNIEELIR